ncbi:MAG: hypothetical protein WCI05_02095 [Myxococcales bacterium]
MNAAATLAKDPSGSRFLYVVGGKGSCTATSSPSLMDCYEYAPIGNDARTGAFVAGASPLASPRQRFGLATLDNTTGPPGYSSSQAFVLASGGDGVTKPQTIEYASVTAGGLLQWQPSPNGSGYSATRDGSRFGVAGGHGSVDFRPRGGACAGPRRGHAIASGEWRSGDPPADPVPALGKERQRERPKDMSTSVGFAAFGGAAMTLGPGHVFGELEYQWGGLSHPITGDAHLAGFALVLGYRLSL